MSKKSKLTLIVDGNWLLISRMAVIHSRYADDNQLCRDLKVMMIKSMNIVLKQFPMIDNIIFVADGGSWRNYLEKPDFLTDDYKGTRIQDPSINWDMIFESYEDFLTKLSQEGITVCKESGIEGDDWCWYWSNKLNNEDTNVMIWSRDKDLTQLVKTNRDGCFTVCWNKDTGVITTVRDDNDMDFLFNMKFNTNEEIFNHIIDKAKNQKEINPNDIIVDKIIRGDLGDNILPVIFRKSKSGSEKQYRVSQKDLNLSLNIHDNTQVKEYFENLLNSKSYKDRVDKSLDMICKHFEYNKKLVVLEEESYPQDILDIMNKYNTYNCNKNITNVENILLADMNKMNNILDFI